MDGLLPARLAGNLFAPREACHAWRTNVHVCVFIASVSIWLFCLWVRGGWQRQEVAKERGGQSQTGSRLCSMLTNPYAESLWELGGIVWSLKHSGKITTQTADVLAGHQPSYGGQTQWKASQTYSTTAGQCIVYYSHEHQTVQDPQLMMCMSTTATWPFRLLLSTQLCHYLFEQFQMTAS